MRSQSRSLLLLGILLFVIFGARMITPRVRESARDALQPPASPNTLTKILGGTPLPNGTYRVPDEGVALPNDIVLQEALIIGPRGDILIRNATRSFSIEYHVSFDRYLIAIEGIPYDTNLQAAELAFLNDVATGSQEKACALNVAVVADPDVFPDRYGEDLPLSFCT